VSTLKTTVASLVEENKKLGEVRRGVPDPEMQQQTMPRTPTIDLTIRPRPQLQPGKRVGTPLPTEKLKLKLGEAGRKGQHDSYEY
jgi:hypothetical protein